MRRSRPLFERETRRFFEWMGKHHSSPICWIKSDGASHAGGEGPEILMMVSALIVRGGLSRDEAWNLSVGEARWMSAAFAKLTGAPVMFGDEELFDDAPIDLAKMSEVDARDMFYRDLPHDLAQATFDKWKADRKGAPC